VLVGINSVRKINLIRTYFLTVWNQLGRHVHDSIIKEKVLQTGWTFRSEQQRDQHQPF